MTKRPDEPESGRTGWRRGNGLSGLMLLLSVAFGLMWVRSFWRWDHLRWDRGYADEWARMVQAISVRGGVNLEYKALTATDAVSRENVADFLRWHPRGVARDSESITDVRVKDYFSVTDASHPLGFEVILRRGNYLGTQYQDFTFAIPYWLPTLLPLLVPLWQVGRRLRRRSVSGFPILPADGTDTGK